MPVDMKKHIAEAARRLIDEKQVKKLTVKDIVEECQVTRQTFYYHFEDLPDLIRWVLTEEFENTLQEALSQDMGFEGGIRRFLEITVGKRKNIEKVLATNYSETIQELLLEHMRKYFLKLIEDKNLFPDASRLRLKVIVNYYMYAVAGIVRNWDMLKTDDFDAVAHEIYLLSTGKIHLDE